MSKVIEDAAKEAAGAIKKIRAGKGAVKGNFYYAGDTRGKAAGLVITLQAFIFMVLTIVYISMAHEDH